MLETILQQRYYITAVLLFSIGFVTLFLHPNLIKKIIGLNLMDTAVFLFLASMGYIEGGAAPIVEEGAKASQYINPVPGGCLLYTSGVYRQGAPARNHAHHCPLRQGGGGGPGEGTAPGSGRLYPQALRPVSYTHLPP